MPAELPKTKPQVLRTVKQLKQYIEDLPDTLKLHCDWTIGVEAAVGNSVTSTADGIVKTPVLFLRMIEDQ